VFTFTTPLTEPPLFFREKKKKKKRPYEIDVLSWFSLTYFSGDPLTDFVEKKSLNTPKSSFFLNAKIMLKGIFDVNF